MDFDLDNLTDANRDELKQFHEEKTKDYIDIIFDRRKELDVSQETIAYFLNTGQSKISRYENRKSLGIKFCTVIRLCEALNLKLTIEPIK